MNQRITFTETAYGHYIPVVVTTTAGVETVRELTKADLNQFESPENVKMSGHLYKKGVNHKNWAKRYFTLHGPFLFYFHDAQDSKPIGVLPLQGCQIETFDPKRSEQQMQQLQQQQLRHGYPFKIVDNTPNKQVFHLFAETEPEREQWVDAINAAIRQESAEPEGQDAMTSARSGEVVIDSTPARRRASLAVLKAAVLRNAPQAQQAGQRTPAGAASGNAAASPMVSAGTASPMVASSRRVAIRRSIVQKFLGGQSPSPVPLTREHTSNTEDSKMQAITAARLIEEECPITFAELFRNQIFTINIPMCEDPQEGTPINVPHMKGDWAEQLMIDVYRRYCGPQGYMGLEQFTEFLNDAAIVSSHLPRSDDDEPDEVLQRVLEPAALMNSLPENLGLGVEEALAEANTRLNFTQFFLLIINIASVVYEELYNQSMSQATGRLVHEVLVPLYTWAQGHDKRGSNDDAVLETRILLLLQAFSSNLWIVFLYYATDHFAHSPSLKLPFPGAAQYQEKLVHGMPKGIVPSKAIAEYLSAHELKEQNATPAASSTTKSVRKVRPSALFITEAAALKFVREYGIMPQLLSRAEVKELYRQINRPKNMLPGRRAFGVTQATMNDANTTSTAFGLSYTEFSEFVVRIALQGMMQKHYHAIYSTPYAKVAALLTHWGVANLARLEEVKLMNMFTV